MLNAGLTVTVAVLLSIEAPALSVRACQEIAFTHAISWHNL
jgi:hypothetical protein